MTFLSMLKESFSKPRINFWKVAAGIGTLQLVINAKTYYENSSLQDQVLRTRFLNWQFSWPYLAQQLLSLVLVSLLCFVVFNVVYNLAIRKASLRSFVAALLPLLVIMLLMDISINYIFYRATFNQLLQAPLAYFSDFLFGSALLATATLIIVKVAISSDIASRNRELELKTAKLELEKRKAEMDLLKAQVNPHFLYNSLNYLYSKSLPHSKELSEGILLLSDIMKYAFHNPDGKEDGMVLLKDEVGYIRKYLSMSTLRFGASFNVSFKQDGTIEQQKIIPFALFTIVENAVKHADASDPQQPIEIRLRTTAGQLEFTCSNKKKPGPAWKETTQVGIANLRGRLAASYGNRYTLEIDNSQHRYSITLKTPSTNGH